MRRSVFKPFSARERASSSAISRTRRRAVSAETGSPRT